LTEDGIYKEAKALWTRMTTAAGAVSSAASNRLRAVQGGKGVSFPGLKGADGDEQGS